MLHLFAYCVILDDANADLADGQADVVRLRVSDQYVPVRLAIRGPE